MGAVTAIMYAAQDPSVACMVVDSPFASLHTLAQELVENTPVGILVGPSACCERIGKSFQLHCNREKFPEKAIIAVKCTRKEKKREKVRSSLCALSFLFASIFLGEVRTELLGE